MKQTRLLMSRVTPLVMARLTKVIILQSRTQRLLVGENREGNSNVPAIAERNKAPESATET